MGLLKIIILHSLKRYSKQAVVTSIGGGTGGGSAWA